MKPPSTSPPANPVPVIRSHRTAVKMITVICLVLLGLIPLTLIRGVLSERRQRHREAIENITSTWGNPQVIAGPMLVVPYQRQITSWSEQIVEGRSERIESTTTVVARAHFLPVELTISGGLEPERLHRGIYDTIVYRTTLQVTGKFTPPSFQEWKVTPEDVLWDEATLLVGITDLRGAKQALQVKWGDQTLSFVPGPNQAGLGTTVGARLPDLPFRSDSIAFDFSVDLSGSQSLSFAPFGMQNRVKLTSSFPDPSFNGAYLPEHRTVTPAGFESDWQVSYYGRGYPHQWSDQDGNPLDGGVVANSLFGVGILPVVDSYRYVERSIKYGLLFLALVFGVFFLCEVRSAAQVHPLQYTLVGGALCLFYLALLSLSEVLPFGWAYLAGAVASTLLVASYSGFVLGGSKRARTVGAGLAATYGLLFVILRQQEYALLYGTGALFLVLALAMYATRRMDWYAQD